MKWRLPLSALALFLVLIGRSSVSGFTSGSSARTFSFSQMFFNSNSGFMVDNMWADTNNVQNITSKEQAVDENQNLEGTGSRLLLNLDDSIPSYIKRLQNNESKLLLKSIHAVIVVIVDSSIPKLHEKAISPKLSSNTFPSHLQVSSQIIANRLASSTLYLFVFGFYLQNFSKLDKL